MFHMNEVIMCEWSNILLIQFMIGLLWNSIVENVSISSEECEKYVGRMEKSENSSSASHEVGNSHWTCPHFRIIGGREALSKEFPHMALIAYDKWATKFFCGGTIISDYYILSAAHCQFNIKWGAAKWVLIGDTDLNSDKDDTLPTLVRITSIIPHPNYTESSFYNDILLFKLERKIFFSSFIRPICLNSETDIENRNVIATGWGRTGQGSKQSRKLLKVAMVMVNESICREIYNPLKFKEELPFGVDTQTMICAGDINGRHDTCEGDSGGPLQVVSERHPCIYIQLGVTSFGKTCGATNSPGVYTRVSYYIQWIEQIIYSQNV